MALSARRIGRAYLLSIAVWCTLALLTGWEYRIFDEAVNIHSSLPDMILLAESRGFAYALLTPPLFYVVRRAVATGRQTFWYFLYLVGLAPFMFVDAAMRWALVPPWDPNVHHYVPRAGHGIFEVIRNGFSDMITMYIAIIAAAHAWVYFERMRKQEMERYEFQQALAASELQALKMQLHPHFLFNTLNGISSLIDSNGPCAKEMVIKLSSLLRTALQHGATDLIPLQEELKFVREYLDLEAMRLGSRLTVRWSIAPDTTTVLVPQLILQPLVENAIRHGVGSSRERGWVEISSKRDGDRIELRVRNSVGAVRPAGSGVGLRNTEARLRHLYAGESALSFVIGDDQTATTTATFRALGAVAPAGEIRLPSVQS